MRVFELRVQLHNRKYQAGNRCGKWCAGDEDSIARRQPSAPALPLSECVLRVHFGSGSGDAVCPKTPSLHNCQTAIQSYQIVRIPGPCATYPVCLTIHFLCLIFIIQS